MSAMLYFDIFSLEFRIRTALSSVQNVLDFTAHLVRSTAAFVFVFISPLLAF